MGCCWLTWRIYVPQQLQDLHWLFVPSQQFLLCNWKLRLNHHGYKSMEPTQFVAGNLAGSMVGSNYVCIMHFPAYQMCIGRTWPTVGGCKPCLTNGHYLIGTGDVTRLAPAPALPLIFFFPHAPYPTSPNPNILQGTPISHLLLGGSPNLSDLHFPTKEALNPNVP